MSITTITQFNTTLANAMSNHSATDYTLQECASFAVAQSFQHRNADPALRLLKAMQAAKYGHVQVMTDYLCKHGNLKAKGNAVKFWENPEAAIIVATMKAEWKTKARTEVIAQTAASKLDALITSFSKAIDGKGKRKVEGLNPDVMRLLQAAKAACTA